MSTAPSPHSAISAELSADLGLSDSPQSVVPVAGIEVILNELQQRELIAPALLLSTGYCALPWILQQVWLLIAPLVAVLGFVPEGAKQSA